MTLGQLGWLESQITILYTITGLSDANYLSENKNEVFKERHKISISLFYRHNIICTQKN